MKERGLEGCHPERTMFGVIAQRTKMLGRGFPWTIRTVFDPLGSRSSAAASTSSLSALAEKTRREAVRAEKGGGTC